MKRRKAPLTAAGLLTPAEVEIVSVTPVWIVWWEEPERSWEAICLSEVEADTEFAARQLDHVIQRWGKAGRHGKQTLLEWFEGHLRVIHPSGADDYTGTVRVVLKRLAAGQPGPITVRTW